MNLLGGLFLDLDKWLFQSKCQLNILWLPLLVFVVSSWNFSFWRILCCYQFLCFFHKLIICIENLFSFLQLIILWMWHVLLASLLWLDRFKFYSSPLGHVSWSSMDGVVYLTPCTSCRIIKVAVVSLMSPISHCPGFHLMSRFSCTCLFTAGLCAFKEWLGWYIDNDFLSRESVVA